MKTRYCKWTHKFGIELPKPVPQKLEIYKKNGNTFWRDSIENKMRNIIPDFQLLEDSENFPVGHQHIKLHIVFNVQMGFIINMCLVAIYHMSETPVSLTYSLVVSHYSVSIYFLFAIFNDLDSLTCVIRNACLNATCQ